MTSAPARRSSPRSLTSRLSGARRGQGGAVLVEAAFAIPVLLLILMGAMEFGLVFASGSVTTGSSRSGARLAATAYAPAGTTSSAQRTATDSIAAAVTADLKSLSHAAPVGMTIYLVNPSATDGAPTGGFPGDNLSGGCTANCIRYVWNGTTMVYSSGSWPSPDACGTTVDSVGVYVQVRHTYISGYIGTSRLVNGRTSMRLEPLPADQC